MTTMGFGKKSDFTQNGNKSPSPNQYPTKSLFEDNKTKGKTFGCAREKSPDRSYLIPQIHKNPGPGQVPHPLLSTTDQGTPSWPNASPSAPRPSTSSKNTPIATPPAQLHTSPSTYPERTEGIRSASSMT